MTTSKDMVTVLAVLISLGLGLGLSCWICATLLYRSNNYGDNYGTGKDYNVSAIFTTRKDRLSEQERTSFTSIYSQRIDNLHRAPEGTMQVRRLTKEELEEYSVAKTVPQAETAANEYVDDIEAEFRAWEQSLDGNASKD